MLRCEWIRSAVGLCRRAQRTFARSTAAQPESDLADSSAVQRSAMYAVCLPCAVSYMGGAGRERLAHNRQGGGLGHRRVAAWRAGTQHTTRHLACSAQQSAWQLRVHAHTSARRFHRCLHERAAPTAVKTASSHLAGRVRARAYRTRPPASAPQSVVNRCRPCAHALWNSSPRRTRA